MPPIMLSRDANYLNLIMITLTFGSSPSCPDTYIVLSAITAWLFKIGRSQYESLLEHYLDYQLTTFTAVLLVGKRTDVQVGSHEFEA